MILRSVVFGYISFFLICLAIIVVIVAAIWLLARAFMRKMQREGLLSRRGEPFVTKEEKPERPLSEYMDVSLTLPELLSAPAFKAADTDMLEAWADYYLTREKAERFHVLVPRTMCHETRVAKAIAADTIHSRVKDTFLGPCSGSDETMGFACMDSLIAYLQASGEVRGERWETMTVYDRSADDQSGSNALREFEVVLDYGRKPLTLKRTACSSKPLTLKRTACSLKEKSWKTFVSDGMLFLRDDSLWHNLCTSCIACASRRRRNRRRNEAYVLKHDDACVSACEDNKEEQS